MKTSNYYNEKDGKLYYEWGYNKTNKNVEITFGDDEVYKELTILKNLLDELDIKIKTVKKVISKKGDCYRVVVIDSMYASKFAKYFN